MKKEKIKNESLASIMIIKNSPIYFIILVFPFLACQTTAQIKNEPVQSSVCFEIKGISKPVKEIEKKEGVLKVDGELTVAAVGDIIPHSNVNKTAFYHKIVKDNISTNNFGYDFLFREVTQELKADISIANYESPIAPVSGKEGRPFVFNSSRHLLRAARDAGINIFNISNNHIYDQGIGGMDETLAIFREEKVDFIGTFKNDRPIPFYIEKNNIKVAIFGFTTLINYESGIKIPGNILEYIRKYNPEIDIQSIKEAKSKSDIVIVYIHWGEEYEIDPHQKQREIADQLINAGADIIIGGHPHVLQPFELIASNDWRIVPVAFSMGNFISNQSRNYVYPISGAKEGNPRDSAILRFKIKKYSYGDISFTVISDLYFVPLWTNNNTILYSKGLEDNLTIYVFPIVKRIDELKKMIESETDEKNKKLLLLELDNLYFRLNNIKSTLKTDLIMDCIK